MTDTTTNTYNGWTNYPTWAVNLWLANDEGLYHMTRAIAAEVVDDSNEDRTVPTYWTSDEYRDDLAALIRRDELRDQLEQHGLSAVQEWELRLLEEWPES